MLSYQHAYHAGNPADIHKHMIVALILDYMVQKDKPVSYIETHAGRGLYNLQSPESVKTGEAAAGILKASDAPWLNKEHPYGRVLADIKFQYGNDFYPGSPMVAAHILRPDDRLHLCEKHPQEFAALDANFMRKKNAKTYFEDGYKQANALCPPTPRRGMMLIDPSYEVKNEYMQAAHFIEAIHKKWPVGVIALWYPILENTAHADMVEALEDGSYTDAFHHQIMFTKANENHRLKGSGMFIINAPYTLSDQLSDFTIHT